jgi:uncharacterized protein YijF (DUF1287 family)
MNHVAELFKPNLKIFIRLEYSYQSEDHHQHYKKLDYALNYYNHKWKLKPHDANMDHQLRIMLLNPIESKFQSNVEKDVN